MPRSPDSMISHDDGTSLGRLTNMKTMTFPILLMTTLGCASEVDLPLDVDHGAESPPSTEPDPPADPADPAGPPDSPPPTDDDLVWSRTDFPATGRVEDVVWTTDGDLVAAIPTHHWVETPPYPRHERIAMTLARHDADGALKWEVSAPPGVVFTDLAATADGGVVAAVRHDQFVDLTPGPGGIDWYDADGTLTESWRLTELANGDLLDDVYKVFPLPDGSVLWAGRRSEFHDLPARPVVGLLDAQRELQWVYTALSFGYPDWAGVTDFALTPGGDIVVLAYASYPVGDSFSHPVSLVIEIGMDGSEHWLKEFGFGMASHVFVAPSGSVVIAGSDETVQLGSLSWSSDWWVDAPFTAELEPRGRWLGLQGLELPAEMRGQGKRAFVHDVSMAGEELTVSGAHIVGRRLAGYFVTTNHPDGRLVSARLFPVRDVAKFDTGPWAAEIGPDGRLAMGGDFTGVVDFGDGEVVSDDDQVGRPFIAVFGPDDEVD